MRYRLKALAGLLLLIGLLIALYKQLHRQDDLTQALHQLHFNTWNQRLLLLVILCGMILNWSLEAIKWKAILQPIEPVSWNQAMRSVLGGVALSFFTPNRVGEYMGRVLFLENRHKWQGIMGTLVGNFSQLLITSFFGISAMCYYLFQIRSTPLLWSLLLISLLIMCIPAYLYFHLDYVVHVSEKIPVLKKISRYIRILHRFNKQTLWRIIQLTAARYFVYTIQFVLLLHLFQIGLPGLTLICCCWMIFWLMALAPTIPIAELGVRGQVAFYVLSPLSQQQAGILLATALLWGINLLVPALSGCFFLTRMKFFRGE